MRNNLNITKLQLVNVFGVSLTILESNIKFLKDNGYLERIGSNK